MRLSISMLRLILASCLLALPMTARAGEAVTITSPAPLPAAHDRARLFLGGSIDMGKATDWQRDMIAALADEKVTILNPRRADWNPAWKPEASDPNFRGQVEWELAALDSADIIILYLAPGTQSPVSLLEMGLHARGGKLIVLCPDGFWRKGNVDITATRYGVEQVSTIEELTRVVRRRIGAVNKALPAAN
ncbi:nucleoside 2-deoxyribosyltransferase domain-containing protein [Sphingobium yanoikuyae]|uniref:nucleoside 2-deoxyribosyltransferase domain-containing protein n=1 Tax=Sphingobium yanoikuyae TaxID=13690 RepID=UPI0028AB7CF1|nr:nucleoside 2-deoxyribosyltransferase domain-containing protein [Sphingobium yanoikuyae]